MSIVNEGNRKKLLANPHVKFVKDKQIGYSTPFIEGALAAAEKGMPLAQYWSSRGFDIGDFKPAYFRKSIARWKLQYRHGEIVHKKKGRAVAVFRDMAEEIAYLRAENAFLKELRALGIQGVITNSGLSPELYRKIMESHAGMPVDWRALAHLAITGGIPDRQGNWVKLTD